MRNESWNEVQDLKIIEFLNSLSYLKAKTKHRQNQEKELRRKYKRK